MIFEKKLGPEVNLKLKFLNPRKNPKTAESNLSLLLSLWKHGLVMLLLFVIYFAEKLCPKKLIPLHLMLDE